MTSAPSSRSGRSDFDHHVPQPHAGSLADRHQRALPRAPRRDAAASTVPPRPAPCAGSARSWSSTASSTTPRVDGFMGNVVSAGPLDLTLCDDNGDRRRRARAHGRDRTTSGSSRPRSSSRSCVAMESTHEPTPPNEAAPADARGALRRAEHPAGPARPGGRRDPADHPQLQRRAGSPSWTARSCRSSASTAGPRAGASPPGEGGDLVIRYAPGAVLRRHPVRRAGCRPRRPAAGARPAGPHRAGPGGRRRSLRDLGRRSGAAWSRRLLVVPRPCRPGCWAESLRPAGLVLAAAFVLVGRRAPALWLAGAAPRRRPPSLWPRLAAVRPRRRPAGGRPAQPAPACCSPSAPSSSGLGRPHGAGT